MTIQSRPSSRSRCRLATTTLAWLVAVAVTALAFPAQAAGLKCTPDTVKVGGACVDTYEA